MGLNWTLVLLKRTNKEAKQRVMSSGLEGAVGTGAKQGRAWFDFAGGRGEVPTLSSQMLLSGKEHSGFQGLRK